MTPIYIIRLTMRNIDGCFVGHNGHWVFDRVEAQRFYFETSAVGYAILRMGLGIDDFVVEFV